MSEVDFVFKCKTTKFDIKGAVLKNPIRILIMSSYPCAVGSPKSITYLGLTHKCRPWRVQSYAETKSNVFQTLSNWPLEYVHTICVSVSEVQSPSTERDFVAYAEQMGTYIST